MVIDLQTLVQIALLRVGNDPIGVLNRWGVDHAAVCDVARTITETRLRTPGQEEEVEIPAVFVMGVQMGLAIAEHTRGMN